MSGADLPKLVTEAMTAIEAEFEPLLGVLPKDYGIFETNVLEDLMRVFNSEQIKRATGDVFGRIYEYFLAKFSIQKAHDNGEFFTPSSIVQTIVNVIEPNHGIVFDPACGSGGMFVQSSHFIEHGRSAISTPVAAGARGCSIRVFGEGELEIPAQRLSRSGRPGTGRTASRVALRVLSKAACAAGGMTSTGSSHSAARRGLLWFCLRNSMSTRRHDDLGDRGWFKELGDAAVALRRLRNTEEC